MKKLTVVLLMFVSFGFAGNASAIDAKSHNGSFCHAYYGNQSSDFRHQSDGIKNKSNGSRWVGCPVIQDRLSAKGGADPIWIHWKNSVAGQNIRCTFFSKKGNGSTLQSRTENDLNGGWFRFSPTITLDDKYGTYYMYCLLPKGSTLNTIWVDEK